jgi:hypothetical protein
VGETIKGFVDINLVEDFPGNNIIFKVIGKEYG